MQLARTTLTPVFVLWVEVLVKEGQLEAARGIMEQMNSPSTRDSALAKIAAGLAESGDYDTAQAMLGAFPAGAGRVDLATALVQKRVEGLLVGTDTNKMEAYAGLCAALGDTANEDLLVARVAALQEQAAVLQWCDLAKKGGGGTRRTSWRRSGT